nr:unnamed protein product [Digitaria exilis]
MRSNSRKRARKGRTTLKQMAEKDELERKEKMGNFVIPFFIHPTRPLLPFEVRNTSMAAARAWLRRAAAPVPRIPFPFPSLSAHPPPAPVLEVPSLAHPAGGIAIDLMAVPKKKVGISSFLLLARSSARHNLPSCGIV